MSDYMKESGMSPMSSQTALSLVATILMTSFGTWGLPQMVHKYYGIRDDREVKRGTVISTFFALLVAGGGYFIGSFSTSSSAIPCRRVARITSSPIC